MNTKNLAKNLLFLLSILLNGYLVTCRKHHLILVNDIRSVFKISSFGYFVGGSLSVNISQLTFQPYSDNTLLGLTIAKTMTDNMRPFLGDRDKCIPDDGYAQSDGLITLLFDFKTDVVKFACSTSMRQLKIFARGKNDGIRFSRRNLLQSENAVEEKDASSKNGGNDGIDMNKQKEKANTKEIPPLNKTRNLPTETKKQVVQSENKQSIVPVKKTQASVTELKQESTTRAPEKVEITEDEEVTGVCDKHVKLHKTVKNGKNLYSFNFQMYVTNPSEIGLYSIYFHNCPAKDEYGDYPLNKVNLSMFIIERNLNSYLSEGEIPLPQLYFALSMIFLFLGVIWINILRHRKEDSHSIHYLMASLVFLKSFSLLFHGINYHFIGQEGSQIETWAVLYYITHLIKGALLFITLVLIGTGWTFVKHILSDKDKKIFMIVIPLQVLANVAEIITDESEEGEMKHKLWKMVFMFVDLICCGAILFPVIWSIKHLQEASHIDGKAAINLKKLKLFRRFYVIIVSYIYFTRIIVFLLRLAVPFQYEWLYVFCEHTATLFFFVLTGYHFRPTTTNPYFRLPQDEDLELEEVLFSVTPNVYTENLTKKKPRDSDDIDFAEDMHQLVKRDKSDRD